MSINLFGSSMNAVLVTECQNQVKASLRTFFDGRIVVGDATRAHTRT